MGSCRLGSPGHTCTPGSSLTHARPTEVKAEGSQHLCVHVCMCLSAHMFIHEQEHVCISKCACKCLCILVPCTLVCLLSVFLYNCMYKPESMYICSHICTCTYVYVCEIRNVFAFICAHVWPHGQECAHSSACVSVCTRACVCGFMSVRVNVHM